MAMQSLQSTTLEEKKQSKAEKKESLSFETAYARLEVILEKMNSGSVGLDESLKLYEEADKLIGLCNKQLTEAERKVEILLKQRTGETMNGADGKPLTQEFNPGIG